MRANQRPDPRLVGPWGRGPVDPRAKGDSLSAARRHDDWTIIGSGSKVRAGRALCVHAALAVRSDAHSTLRPQQRRGPYERARY